MKDRGKKEVRDAVRGDGRRGEDRGGSESGVGCGQESVSVKREEEVNALRSWEAPQR